MNLLVSYNWLKDYVKLRQTPQEFARRISLSGPSVERIHPQGEGLENIVVGKILKVKPHPNADKLRVVETDLGTMTKEIVCGGSNLAEGQLVVVAMPGAMVKWHGEGEPVEIKAAKLRGVDSYGMICGADEVGLVDLYPKKEEREVVDLTPTGAKPGTLLAKALGLDDVIFDVEVTSNRPDAMCMIGLALEAAAVFNAPLTAKTPPAPKLSGKAEALKVEVHAKKLCPRYQALVMRDVRVGPSPLWMKKRLAASGVRSINNLVDITNYVMLEFGQPLHVFDYDTLKGGKIIVREAKDGEKMKALDGNTYALKPGQLVIADAERPVAVAGVMGGEETGTTERTKTIVFEAAAFDPVSVRRTARALGLHSDSSLRFEKGLSTEMTSAALARAAELAQELAAAQVASKPFDVRAGKYKPLVYPFRPARANELIGVDISAAEQRRILTALGFVVKGAGATWKVTAPHWRDHDIEGERDLVEEVARVYGYDNLPSVIPEGPLPLPEPDAALVWEDRVKRVLKLWGFTELMTYSFISKAMIGKWDGPKSEDHLRILNPLTEDFEYMRRGILSSVLEVIAQNQEERVEGRAFELANVYAPRPGDLPAETPRLVLASWSRENGGDVRRVIGTTQVLMKELGIVNLKMEKGDCANFHPGRSRRLHLGGQDVGVMGEIHPAILKRFKIERRVAAVSLDAATLFSYATSRKAYRSIPEFPPVKRDVAFVIDRRREHAEVAAALESADPLLSHTSVFDVFEDAKLGEGKKSMAYHLEFSSPERTLTAAEVDAIMDRIRATLKKDFGAELR